MPRPPAWRWSSVCGWRSATGASAAPSSPRSTCARTRSLGVEVLLRWRDEHGMIQAPGDFIDLAIELGPDQRDHPPGAGRDRAGRCPTSTRCSGRTSRSASTSPPSRPATCRSWRRSATRSAATGLARALRARTHRGGLLHQEPLPARGPAAAARDRRPGLDRRFRRRLFVAGGPGGDHRGRVEDRPLLHHRHRQAAAQPDRPEGDRVPRPGPRHVGGRRGRRDLRGGRLPARRDADPTAPRATTSRGRC